MMMAGTKMKKGQYSVLLSSPEFKYHHTAFMLMQMHQQDMGMWLGQKLMSEGIRFWD